MSEKELSRQISFDEVDDFDPDAEIEGERFAEKIGLKSRRVNLFTNIPKRRGPMRRRSTPKRFKEEERSIGGLNFEEARRVLGVIPFLKGIVDLGHLPLFRWARAPFGRNDASVDGGDDREGIEVGIDQVVAENAAEPGEVMHSGPGGAQWLAEQEEKGEENDWTYRPFG